MAAPACAAAGIGASPVYSFALLFAAPLAIEHLQGGSNGRCLALLHANVI